MKKYALLLAVFVFTQVNSYSQPQDFVPGANIIFEDNFSQDPLGDLPAKWNTSAGGEVVQLDGFDGKWFKVSSGTYINPELKKKLPIDFTVEFDLVLKDESCPVFAGVTPIASVVGGKVWYKKIFVQLQHMAGYPDVVFGKDVTDLGSKTDFSVEGAIGRITHVSMSVNQTRFRVWLDDTKVVDLPKVVTPDYHNNIFIMGGEVIPAPQEGIYISNMRIAAGEADARRLLIKQLYEQGSVVTTDVQFTPNTNTLTPESLPSLDNLGQAMQTDPNLNIQLNSLPATAADAANIPGYDPNAQPSSYPDANATFGTGTAGNQIINKEALKAKADKIKAYLMDKFKVAANRIITDAKQKLSTKVNQVIDTNKGLTKAKNFLLEIVKL